MISKTYRSPFLIILAIIFFLIIIALSMFWVAEWAEKKFPREEY